MTDSETDDDLIDRVVEQIMLGRDPDVEGLIARTSDMAPAVRDQLRKIARSFGAAVIEAQPAMLPFTELGPYHVLARIGEGGMGMVYLAEHRFLERRVALKVIRPELALSPVTRQRFHREALRIAKLRHENIVSVYDAGEHEGVTYLAMEWVEGRGLDEVLREARSAGRRMDAAAAVRHARDIALALQCAHAAGIIHRDVKPANVRITPDGRALLLDFGLSFAEEATSLSGLGQFVGTPQYASPEQIESGSADIDARTDIYSLGITLYECLTGDVPFTGASLKQLFQQILTRDPVEPRTLNASVDEKLNGIVMRACSKRCEDRFESAGEMARALEEWLGNAGRPAPTARKKSALVARWTTVGVVLAVILVAWFAFHRSDDALVKASQRSQPVVRVAPHESTALLGASELAFDQRMNEWEPVIGGGTFGADEDGAGVIGLSAEGITGRAHVLPRGNGCVSGRLEPIPPKPGERTSAAGAGVEFSNGRIVALLFVAAAHGYELRLCELTRDGGTRLTRSTELASVAGAWPDEPRLEFRLSWNGTDTQFDWLDAGTPGHSSSLSIPRALRDAAEPRRILLIVENGNARFEELVLQES